MSKHGKSPEPGETTETLGLRGGPFHLPDMSGLSAQELQQLIHELWTRNNELEKQNEELRNASLTGRKQSDEALRETTRLNQILLDAFPCVALLLRPQTREIVAANRAAILAGAVPGEKCFNTWGQREDPCPWCLAPSVWATGEPRHREVESLGVIWDAHWIPVDSDLYMHYAFNVTERKRAESAFREALRHLKRSHAQTQALLTGTKALLEYRNFHESLRQLFAACRELAEASVAFAVLTSADGQQQEFLFFDGPGLLFRGDVRSAVPQEGLFATAYKSGKVVFDNDFSENALAQFLPQDLGTLDNALFAPLMIKGEAVGLLGLANRPGGFNSNDAVLAEAFAELASIGLMNRRTLESLEQSEERMRLLIESAPVGIRIATGGRYTYVNPAFVQMFGYDSPEEILGRTVESSYSPEHRSGMRQRLLDQASGKNEAYHYQVVGIKKDGQPLELEAWGTQIRYQNNLASLAFLVDVSEAKSLRSQLIQAQKMEAIGTLAGGIAHDFNNLLTIVSGYSELLLTDRSPEDLDCQDLQKINSAARRGAELVQRLLTFSRKTESKPRPMNLNHQIEQVRKLLERTIPKMIRIRLVLDGRLGIINADPTQMEQILMNIALNAKDAMPDGGELTIETKNVTLDEDFCSAQFGPKPGCYVLLTVSDSGGGMDEEIVQHIFEPFYTTKGPGKGTGLGLAMVYGIVKQHNGHITCQSDPEVGTTFSIYLPVMTSELELTKAEQFSVPRGGTETVLLVDDEDHVIELGTRILSKAGYTVLTARNGAEALEIYQKESSNISLVVLDLIMPEMGGKQCFRELGRINPHVKVVISSGYSSGGTLEYAFQLGARGFISKPYDVTQLLRTLREALDGE